MSAGANVGAISVCDHEDLKMTNEEIIDTLKTLSKLPKYIQDLESGGK
jgi:hypothetical protein